MKKILLITALFAGLAGSGFAIDGEQVFYEFSDGDFAGLYDSEEDSNDSSGAEVFDRNQQKYDQILLAGIEDIGARRGEWTEEQKIAAIDNLNKFENNETQASGHEITEDMKIEMAEAFPNTWICIRDCCNKGEVGLVKVDGTVKYKYVKLEDADPEQKQLRINLGYVCLYNERARCIYMSDLRGWTRLSPAPWEIEYVNKGLEESILQKQTLGTADPNKIYWTARFVEIPDFEE